MDQYLEFISNHSMLVLALAVVTFLLIKEFSEAAFSQYEQLSPTQAVAKMNATNLVIIDVREPPEFATGHIENAISIPVGKIKEQFNVLESYRNQAILVVCQSGTRSMPVCKMLTKAGFEQVANLDGGMQSWEDNKFPIKTGKK